LEATPPFEALPYVWGPMNENKELSLQGCRMKITDNLWGALIQLRSATASRLLWVDALAINQTDLQERSDQVRLMRDMYTKATSTLVWLGEERDHSQMAMSFLKRLEERGSQTEVISRVLRNGFEDPLFLAIECLYTQREYWTRLWVVQEI
ncbi:heterokaryon incompatibility, partial [Phaeosphaeria sp. MPI-PUGE-AT-0046c]